MPVPRLGPDIFDPRQVELIKEYTLKAQAGPTEGAEKAAAGPKAKGPAQLSEKARARIEAAKARMKAKKAGQ